MPAEGVKFTRAEIATYYSERVPDLKQARSDEWRGPCPVHEGERNSFAVNAESGCWHCFSECDRGGSMIDLEMALGETDFKTAKAEVLRIIGRTWHTVATYIYTNESGEPIFRVIRRERGEGAGREKAFHQERNVRGRWVKGLDKVRRIPYRLHKLVNAKHVLVVEGEKDCDTIRQKLKLVATTNPMGAGKWSSEYNRYFAEKNVTIIADNDRAGHAHAVQVAEALLSVAASVRVLELPGVPEKGDVTDWVHAGGTGKKLQALVRETPVLDELRIAAFRTQWGMDGSHLGLRFPFEVTDEGVFLRRDDQDEPVKLSARVDVTAQTRDAAGENWGRLLVWKDNEDRTHQWAMPMELLASDAGAVRARLLAEGLPFITTNARLRERFTEYLQTAPVDRRVRCVGRIGWHVGTYVVPDAAIGPEGSEEVLHQTQHEAVHHWNVHGTIDEWRDQVGHQCGGNSRLILAASCGFAGPLLSLIGAESGGVHFHGATSTGKSTALIVGGSVCGGRGQTGFVQTWRTTINGLEAIAEAHNDATLSWMSCRRSIHAMQRRRRIC
jgi:hypothetical protein